MKVTDFMSKDVLTISQDATVKQMFLLMDKYKVDNFAVVNSFNELVGVISERDMLRAVYASFGEHGRANPAPEAIDARINAIFSKQVKEIMVEEFVYLHPWATTEEAGAQMFAHNSYRLPVLDDGKVIGVIGPAAIFLSLIKKKFIDEPADAAGQNAFMTIPGAPPKSRGPGSVLWRKAKDESDAKDPKKKRAYRRAPEQIKVVYRLVKGTQSLEDVSEGVTALTKDVGAGGLLVEIGERFAAGTLLYVKFKLRESGEIIQPLCRVCWCKELAKDNCFDVGIAFLALGSQERIQIDRYVNEKLGDAVS